MTRRGNKIIPNAHFRKHWQQRVKTWFNQPGQKKRRRVKRLRKAVAVAPRPAAGSLRPVVHCPTARYNIRTRLGRGFTLDELKQAKIPRRFAPTIGIAVDHRRKNRSLESQQVNVQRLKEYRSRLILFPTNSKKPQKGDSDPEAVKMATQLKGPLMPIKHTTRRPAPRKITEDETKYSVFEALRKARADARLVGVREKRAKQREEEEKQTKKPPK